MSRFNSWEYRPNNTAKVQQSSSFVYEQTMQKYSPVYKSPVSSKQRLNISDNLSSETRQKTEPNSQQNLYKAEMREKELLLKKSQQEILVLKEENQSLMRLNQQYKLDLQSLHEENNKKTIKIGMIEMQLDVLKRKSQKDQDREFRSQSSHVQQSRDSSPYRNQQSQEDELFQLRQDKARLQSEVLNQKKIIHDMSQARKGLPQSKSDTEFRNLRDFYKNEIDDLKTKLMAETQVKSSDRKYQHRISNLEIEVASMKDQQAFADEQINQLRMENQSLKDFIQDQLQKNKTLMRNVNDLQNEKERFLEKLAKHKQIPEKDSMRDQQAIQQIKSENNQLRLEMQQVLDENERLSQKISQLYVELNQKNNNDDLNTMKQQQLQIQGLQEQLSKGSEDRKRLNASIEMLKKQIIERDMMIQNMQSQKQLQMHELEDQEVVIHHSVGDIQQNEEIESAIKLQPPRFLPELQVGSHVNCVLHVLEPLGAFAQLIKENANADDICQSLQRLFDFVQNKSASDHQQLKSEAVFLSETFQIDQQVENRANDFLFQIIDTFSKIIMKDDTEEPGPIAKIIQQRDSPIFDMFFFLQRSLPLIEEIQPNEVPLINSIKHIKYLEPQAKLCDNLGQYIVEVIKYEGSENGSMDDTQFNFVVFPNVLVLNVFELSQAKCNMIINQYLEPSCLTNERLGQPFRYRLIAMIHCSQGNEPLYYLTMETQTGWVQVLYDQYETINKLDQVLTFKKNQGDKELLIYEKVIA